jgi:Tfp pilus assembly protein PilO
MLTMQEPIDCNYAPGNAMPLTRSIPRFHFSARLHWPWVAGFALSGFAAAVSVGELPGLRLQAGALDRQAASLQAQLRTPIAAGRSGQGPNLRAQLATLDRLSVVTSDLQALASTNGLELLDANYKPVGETANAQIGRIDINARLKGSYPALKKAIDSLLALHEGLALESMSVRRQRATDTVVEVELRFTYFYRNEEP